MISVYRLRRCTVKMDKSFSCVIENLGYDIIETEIANHFDMGEPDNSGLPIEMREDESGKFVIVCSRKSGEFNISVKPAGNGKYMLFVSAIGKIK